MGTENPALTLLAAAVEVQAELIADWMSVGFIHGVMNTDNMTLSGETIDYGPCAFMDDYAPGTVFSSIDQTGRYAYGNQPGMGQWTLARLAEALLPLIDSESDRAVAMATEVLRGYVARYDAAWLRRMRGKLGLVAEEAGDAALAAGLLSAMEGQAADWTLTFRALSAALRGDAGAFQARFAAPERALAWLETWRARQARESGDPARRAAAMDRANPAVIPRNHKVEEALTAAVAGDLDPSRRCWPQSLIPMPILRGASPLRCRHPRAFRTGSGFCGPEGQDLPMASQKRKKPWVASGQSARSSSRRQRTRVSPRAWQARSTSASRVAMGPTGA